MTPLRPAIFLDRDGVINDIVWRNGQAASPRSLAELVVAEDLVESLNMLKAAGFLLMVVTNQPDVRRGLMSQAALDSIHARLLQDLPLDAISACRHDNQDACACRKPKPGLVLELAQQHGVDLGRSWLVGDQERDIQCGRRAGCQTALLARPYNDAESSLADYVIKDFSEVVALAVSPAALTPISEGF